MSCKLAVQRSQLVVILLLVGILNHVLCFPTNFFTKRFSKKYFVQNETLKKYEL